MKQSEMLAVLKELSSDLLRYAAGSDSIVPGAYVEALDWVFETLELYRWRKVEDELPEDGETVLTYKNGIVEVQEFDNRRQGWIRNGWFWSMVTVSHWMPLPEPPKGERK